MRFIRLIILAFLVQLSPSIAAAQDQEVAVRGDAARTEIERILNADNLDTTRLSPREVADMIAGIERGRAPEDFWDAYRTHVRAWERLADAVDTAQRQQGESTFLDGEEELAAALLAINTTFEEVERIAREHGARMPNPAANSLPTI